MKKAVVPSLLFVAVFLTSLLRQEFTLLGEENVALFLMAPDYMREVFSAPLPLSHLLGNFLAQFFRFPYVGPAIVAFEIVAVYLSLRCALRFLRFGEPVAALLACAAWWLSARADNPSETAAFVLVSAAVCLLAVPLNRKVAAAPGAALPAVAVVLLDVAIVLASSALVCSDRTVRLNERMAAIEQYSFSGRWNKVLSLASPEFTADYPEMLPYALLALSETGRLKEEIQNYPVESQDDLEGTGFWSYHGYMSGALLYNALGCRNESVHRLYQAASYLPHGTGFLVLRTLVAHYCALGDYTLARKYCDILSRSCAHRKYVDFYWRQMAGKADREPDSAAQSASSRIMTDSHAVNISNLRQEGIVTDISVERFEVALILARSSIDVLTSASGPK